MSTRQDEAERALTELLAERLPRPRAPEALHARLSELVVKQRPSQRWPGVLAGLGAFAAAAAVLLMISRTPAPSENPLLREVVNDHLRVLYAQHPVEIESGGIHQVKPWFSGRLDFAPRVTVEDDPEWPLVGGSISYVLDRKAATFVYTRRLHTISLFVFPDGELPWPQTSPHMLGDVQAQAMTARGYNVLLFKRQDLGYALVSDLSMRELSLLGEKLAAP
jgi:anti-sigma factor RsiW